MKRSSLGWKKGPYRQAALAGLSSQVQSLDRANILKVTGNIMFMLGEYDSSLQMQTEAAEIF